MFASDTRSDLIIVSFPYSVGAGLVGMALVCGVVVHLDLAARLVTYCCRDNGGIWIDIEYLCIVSIDLCDNLQAGERLVHSGTVFIRRRGGTHDRIPGSPWSSTPSPSSCKSFKYSTWP